MFRDEDKASVSAGFAGPIATSISFALRFAYLCIAAPSAVGRKRNDLNEQMRTIASQLTAAEMHAVAALYGAGATTRVAEP